LPYGSDVAFDEAGNLRSAYLRETTAVQGHACKGRGKLYPTLFYPNGKLASCSLERDEEIRGVPCAGAGVVDDMMGKGPRPSSGTTAPSRAARPRATPRWPGAHTGRATGSRSRPEAAAERAVAPTDRLHPGEFAVLERGFRGARMSREG